MNQSVCESSWIGLAKTCRTLPKISMRAELYSGSSQVLMRALIEFGIWSRFFVCTAITSKCTNRAVWQISLTRMNFKSQHILQTGTRESRFSDTNAQHDKRVERIAGDRPLFVVAWASR